MGSQGFEDVSPDPLLLRRADDAEADLVDRVVDLCQRLILGYGVAIIGVGGKGVSAGLGEALGRHHREGLFVRVDHPDTVYTGMPRIEALMRSTSPGLTPASDG